MREAQHIIQQHFPSISVDIELVWIKLMPRKKQSNKFKLKFKVVKPDEIAA